MTTMEWKSNNQEPSAEEEPPIDEGVFGELDRDLKNIYSSDEGFEARLSRALEEGVINTDQYNLLQKKYLDKVRLVEDQLSAVGAELNDEVKRLERDGVTGLLRHEALERRLPQLIKELNPPTGVERRKPHLQKVVLFFIDLDNLKLWNDISRKSGDLALQTLTKIVLDVVHDGGFMFRRGDQSDEIIGMIRIDRKVSNKKLTEGLIKRIKDAINSGFLEIEGVKMPITVAFGSLILEPGEKRTPDEILEEVDRIQTLEKEPAIKQARISAAQERFKK